jgi:hypothetical protein
VGLQFGGDETRMRLDAIEDARQQRLFQVAIAQPADRGYCDRDQKDHREGEPGCKRHRCFRAVPLPPRHAAMWDATALRRITGRKQYSRRAGMTMDALWRQDNWQQPPVKRPV